MQNNATSKVASHFTRAAIAALVLLSLVMLFGRFHWRFVPQADPQASERLIEHIVAQGGERSSIRIEDQWGSCGHVNYRGRSGQLLSSIRFVVLPSEVLLDHYTGFELGKAFQEAWMKSACRPAARRFSG